MRSLALSSVFAAAAFAAGASPGCVSPELDGTNWSCSSSDECGKGYICAREGVAGRCVASETSGDIHIGMSAPFKGTYEELGVQMRRGIEAYFKRVNAQGGVQGRLLKLDALDDGYDPGQALENTKKLLDIQSEVAERDQPDVLGPNGVLAFLGNVGTPTMLVTAPLATKNRTVFFAPFTGANEYLRDNTKSPYVFNYRASYYEETAAMVDYLFKARAPRVNGYDKVVAFVQDDSFGDAGYVGFTNAYNLAVAPLPNSKAIARVTYERSDPVGSTRDRSVSQVTEWLEGFVPAAPPDGDPPAAGDPVPLAVVMIDTYVAGNVLIRGVKDWINQKRERSLALDVTFLNVSFVGADSLAAQLSTTPDSYSDVVSGDRRTYAENVIVTQVVPDYLSEAPGVREYRADIGASDQGEYTFNSLEGYIAAKLFVEGLRAHQGPLTSPALAQTFETKMSAIDVGIGHQLGFSLTDHQASDKVWGSRLTDAGPGDAKFEIIWTWTRDGGIVLE
jgi:branched-chain amino acid transport system substrate-binding protein